MTILSQHIPQVTNYISNLSVSERKNLSCYKITRKTAGEVSVNGLEQALDRVRKKADFDIFSLVTDNPEDYKDFLTEYLKHYCGKFDGRRSREMPETKLEMMFANMNDEDVESLKSTIKAYVKNKYNNFDIAMIINSFYANCSERHKKSYKYNFK